jgi:hypothetical protein
MKGKPVARALLLCEQLIIAEGTRDMSLINCFAQRRVEGFPVADLPFTVFAVLANGSGRMTAEVVVLRLTDLGRLYRRVIPVFFADRHKELRFFHRIVGCPFPSAGGYEVVLWVNDEILAQATFEVRTF